MDFEISFVLQKKRRLLRGLTHNGKEIRHTDALAILKVAHAKGYKMASEIPDEMIDRMLKELNPT
jgi:hypothetical protein